MFGHVTVAKEYLTPEASSRYDAFYCGVCHAIQSRYGFLPRLSLTYDMTFLCIFLSSMYEPEEHSFLATCPAHPFQKRDCIETPYTSYAAAMNTALAYYKCMDDWKDEKKLLHGIYGQLLSPGLRKAVNAYPVQTGKMSACLSSVSRAENGDLGPDAAANAFGELVASLFIIHEQDHFAGDLMNFGTALGRFIYFADAMCDLTEDRKSASYNPFVATELNMDDISGILEGLLNDACSAFEHLPVVRDVDILRNILYNGIRKKYAAAGKLEHLNT